MFGDAPGVGWVKAQARGCRAGARGALGQAPFAGRLPEQDHDPVDFSGSVLHGIHSGGSDDSQMALQVVTAANKRLVRHVATKARTALKTQEGVPLDIAQEIGR